MNFPSQEEVRKIREKYPEGTKIRLLSMNDPYTKLQKGDIGVVSLVDDDGLIHINWERGSTLALIVGEDEFEVIK